MSSQESLEDTKEHAASRSRAVFISYRRDDSAGYAGRLQDSLMGRRAGWKVFVDVDSISPGRQFDRVIHDALTKSDVMLALVGPSWVGQGLSRLFDPEDFVRLEISMGLAAGIPVIPVLLRDASLPSPAALPPELSAMLGRQAFRLRDVSWRTDVDALIRTLEGLGTSEPVAETSSLAAKLMSAAPTPSRRTGDGTRAGRVCAGALTWLAAAVIVSALQEEGVNASPQLYGGLAGVLNAYLVTLSLENPMPPSLRWAFVLGLAVALGGAWQIMSTSLGESGVLCAALVSGFLTVPWQGIRLRPAALRTPHRAWRCIVGALAWLLAAVVGYAATQSVSPNVIPVVLGGSFGGTINGFLLGRLAENGRWSWRTATSTIVGLVAGTAAWYEVAGLYPERSFVAAALASGSVTGIVLALPLPAAEGRVIGTTWRSSVGALIFAVIGLFFLLSRDLIDAESWTLPAFVTGIVGGAVNGLLVFSRTYARRLTWMAAFALGGGIVWAGFQLVEPDFYPLYAILSTAYGGFFAHRAIGASNAYGSTL